MHALRPRRLHQRNDGQHGVPAAAVLHADLHRHIDCDAAANAHAHRHAHAAAHADTFAPRQRVAVRVADRVGAYAVRLRVGPQQQHHRQRLALARIPVVV